METVTSEAFCLRTLNRKAIQLYNKVFITSIFILTGMLCFQNAFCQDEPIGGEDGINGLLYLNTNDNTAKKKKIVQDTDFIKAIPGFEEANILLFKHKRGNANGLSFQQFSDASDTKNYYKKINDSVYNIYITDLGKPVLFVHKPSKKYGIGLALPGLGGLNAPNIMGNNIDTLLIKNKNNIEKYAVQSFNPFLYGLQLSIIDKQQRIQRTIFTFNILFQFPKPLLIGITTDTSLINKKKNNPSFSWYSIYKSEDKKSGRIFSHNRNSILFAFEHIGGYPRTLYFDNLQYKLDNVSSDWSLTPLAQTPSILLENIRKGKHTLYVRYPAETAKIFVYTFYIKTDWKDSSLWYILLGIMVSAVLFYFIFRARLKRAREKAQKTKLELQAIQAQLNPHFMFNALGSIQYLVNGNEKAKANQYLTEFSSLLRNSLYNNEQEMVPLSKELQTMDSYIRLEQLRFGFRYKLDIDKNIQPENISVPTLLIQPMIENAIKHGIASLKENGMLLIGIHQQAKDLTIEIKDNGKGFDIDQSSKGFGIKLVKERIAVLNRQGYHIRLSINAGEGTIVQFVFENWM